VLSSWRAVCGCAVTILLAPAGQGAAQAATQSPVLIPTVSGPLTLDRALDLAGRYDAIIRAADLRAGAAQSRIRDAGRAPNPVLSGAAENFGGSLDSGRLERTVELSQTLELGGDRHARAAIAAGEYRLASAEAAVLRRETLAVTAERFIRAWSLQQRLARLRQGEELTAQAILAASKRHQSGAAPLLERSRAESQALSQAVDRQRTEAELAAARRELALSWGDTRASFDSLMSDSISSRPDAAARLDSSPDLERANAAQALAAARLRAAGAARIPDVTLSGGVRHLRESRGTGFIAAVELPLPLWSRGGGAVSAAQRDRDAAAVEARALTQRLEVELANASERVESAASAYDTLRRRALPARQSLLEEVLRAYRAGRLSYLDLVAEQRNLLETDLALVDAQADLWRSRLRLELIAGSRPREEEGR
jgi:outer membrane protein, heavy metal efflux system